MSTPATAATDTSAEQGTVAFKDKVNEVTSKLVQNDDGIYELPEGLDISEEVKIAAMAEKRRRDTQSALAKTKSTLAVLQAENEELKRLAKQSTAVKITPEEQEALDELKFSDPDAWRTKMNELEQSATAKVDSTLSEISEKAATKGTVGERQVLLQAFLDDNPGLVINDDVLENEIPPRITKALENGEVSFIEFLGNVKEYLSAGKVVATEQAPKDPNLSEVGGSDTPELGAQIKDSESLYEDELY